MKRFVTLLSLLVRRAPGVVLGIVVVMTGGLIALSQENVIVSGNEGFAPDNAELRAAEILGERFGETGEEVVQLLVEGPDVVSADGLAAVGAITDAVRSSDIAPHLAERPERPAVVSYLFPVQQALSSAPPGPLEDAVVDDMFVDAVAQLPEEQAGFVTGLLPDGTDVASANAGSGLVLVFLNTSALEAGDSFFDELIALELDLAESVAQADLPAGFSAQPFSFALLFGDQDTFNAELGRLFGSAFVIILLILGVVYWLKPRGVMTRLGAGRRTLADVLLTMATIVMAISWMNGISALLGPGYLGVIAGLSDVAQIVPVLLIGLGVDYAIHLTSRYREEVAGGATVEGGIERAVRSVGVALILATVTTTVGFLTNIINPVPALRDFGIIAAAGIVSAFVLMLTFVPAARLLLDRRAERAGRLPREAFATTSARVLPGLMARTAVLAEKAPIPTLLVTVVLGGGLGVFGLSQLETRFSSTDFVPDDSPIVTTLETIIDRFGGGFGETTQVLLEGGVATSASHNALVGAMETLAGTEDVATFGGRAQAESPVAALAALMAPPPGAGADSAPPAFAQEASALGVQPDLTVAPDADVGALYSAMLAAAPDVAGRVFAADDAGRVELVRVAVQTTAGEAGAAELLGDFNAAFAPVEAAGVDATATSNPIINHVIITALQESQVSSLLVTMLAALLLLVVSFAVQYRRPFLGVITTAPVALVVLWTFGMMAATNIPFGPVTATIAALAIGIGVPYTIHITHRYQEDRLRFDDPAEAIRSTVRHTGGALAGSAFTTMAGFGILVTSSLTPFRQFGLVTAYAIGFALLASAIVLPSMLALWDAWHRRKAPPATPAQPETPEPLPEPAGV